MEKLVTQVTLVPDGGTIYDQRAFTIEKRDEGGGEFVEVRNVDSGHGLRIDVGDWYDLRLEIDDMIARCRG